MFNQNILTRSIKAKKGRFNISNTEILLENDVVLELTKNKSKLYVTSGVGCWGPKMRLGTFNEIIIINLISK